MNEEPITFAEAAKIANDWYRFQEAARTATSREITMNDDDMATLRRAFKESEDRVTVLRDQAAQLAISSGTWRAACQTNERLLEQDAETIRDLRAQNAKLEVKLRIAEMKNAGSLANNLCQDHRDKQTGKPCLACTVETRERQNAELLAALRVFTDCAEAREYDGTVTIWQLKDAIAKARATIAKTIGAAP